MRRFLSIIAAASRKFSIPLYLDKYIIMDYDGTKQKDRQLFLTESIACAAIPERSGRVFFMSHNLLSINAQVSIKINRDTAIFLNKCLENRKIRINTHTHTHTHTHTRARASRYYKIFNYQRITEDNSIRLSPTSDNHSSKIQYSSVFSGTKRNGSFVWRYSSNGFSVPECRQILIYRLYKKATILFKPKMKSCHENYARK